MVSLLIMEIVLTKKSRQLKLLLLKVDSDKMLGRKLNALHGLETSCKRCRRRLLVILNA